MRDGGRLTRHHDIHTRTVIETEGWGWIGRVYALALDTVKEDTLGGSGGGGDGGGTEREREGSGTGGGRGGWVVVMM